jgi:hypothetical protein
MHGSSWTQHRLLTRIPHHPSFIHIELPSDALAFYGVRSGITTLPVSICYYLMTIRSLFGLLLCRLLDGVTRTKHEDIQATGIVRNLGTTERIAIGHPISSALP